ncbi:MAG: DUF1553 domain-containing protein [Rikenellaceae bacterium]
MRRFVIFIISLLIGVTQSFASVGKIDQLVGDELSRVGIVPSERCSDEVFVRRVYLALAGQLPTIDECSSFLADGNMAKRDELINALLDSEKFVDVLVLKWGDLLKVKSEFPSNIWPNGVQAYNRWIREQMRVNRPYNEFVVELLTSTGSNFRSPAVSFYRAFVQRTPEIIADNIELLFLGRREVQPHAAEFFSQIKYKSTGEWKEEIVYVDLDTEVVHREVMMSDGRRVTLRSGVDLRGVYARWLTSDKNKQFADVMANRVWYWLFGQGIVHEPDDFRDDNTPSNSKLLDYLGGRLIELNYDVRALIKEIVNSGTFQRSSLSTPENRAEGLRLFAYYPTTRLSAEQIIDGISRLTGVNDRYVSRVPEPYSYYPVDLCSSDIGDATVSSPQLDLFGRPSRDNSLESGRTNILNSKQTLYLLNSNTIIAKIDGSSDIEQMVGECSSREEVIDNVYLMLLSRYPSGKERETISGIFASEGGDIAVARSLIWAIINTSEFLFNH